MAKCFLVPKITETGLFTMSLGGDPSVAGRAACGAASCPPLKCADASCESARNCNRADTCRL